MKLTRDTFMYFAYGSNLLTERIRINNPTAIKRAVAELEGYALTFNLYGKRWHGAAATITPDVSKSVWGVVWTLDKTDLHHLDAQEWGYEAIDVRVRTREGESLSCRTYIMPPPYQGERTPSVVYKNVIVSGAVEHALPSEYVEQLRRVEDNGYNGPVDVPLTIRG